jgi:NAD(P)H-quinone oxidoreductase subunit 5
MSASLEASAVLLALAVVLRSALLPVHGWLIQVMEAPTPVSALLHAGVVNLGGFVLIRFAPLLSEAMPARTLLVVAGLATAVLAGMVMLTRISIKVRLAWSTAAQMGFMIAECGLGLYTLAALHLIGHSLYKAHAFLSASSVVRDMRLRALHTESPVLAASLWLAPLASTALVMALQDLLRGEAWPWWWSVVLGLAWAPLLWVRPGSTGRRGVPAQLAAGLLGGAGLTGLMLLAHALPFGLPDAPHDVLGMLPLLGMGGLYLALAALQRDSAAMRGWRRWSYAGFYVDEIYTRFALKAWPARWAHGTTGRASPAVARLGPART